MRVLGFASLLVLSAAVLQAQPPLPPGAPPAPAADPVLDDHWNKWQQTLGKYSGSVLCMKPNLARLSVASTTDKNDFEAYICNGKSLFEYNWGTKTITEIPLAPGQGDNLMLDFIGGMNAAAAKKRFIISQFNPADKNYIYFDIKPTLAKDKQEFEHIRFALYGPNVPAPFKPYLPAQMYMLKPNGDAEMWKFNKQTADVPGIGAQHFQYEEPKDAKNWNKRKAGDMPPLGPTVPAGGAVRPTK
jgi:TIGR03009 family protein